MKWSAIENKRSEDRKSRTFGIQDDLSSEKPILSVNFLFHCAVESFDTQMLGEPTPGWKSKQPDLSLGDDLDSGRESTLQTTLFNTKLALIHRTKSIVSRAIPSEREPGFGQAFNKIHPCEDPVSDLPVGDVDQQVVRGWLIAVPDWRGILTGTIFFELDLNRNACIAVARILPNWPLVKPLSN